VPFTRRALVVSAVLLAGSALAACGSDEKSPTPDLAARGTAMTVVKPTKRDLTNKVSLTGKVVLNPVYGLVAPVDGEVRYLDVRPPTRTPTRSTRVATVWDDDDKPHHIEVPAGSAFAGRLVDDRADVTAGMPVVSAKYAGYALVADLDGGQAYQIAGSTGSVIAQIKNGPGPFPCALLGTIAALPAGTVPEDPPPAASSSASAAPPPVREPGDSQNSEPTGLRLTCTGSADIKMINGAAATLEVVTQSAKNVLTLPVEAVAGRQGKGQVDVVGADGQRQTREVVLGLTDGKVIEIRSGLTGDENIAVPGPNLATPAPGENGPGGFPGQK
jgi:hypothetical protein